MGDNIFVAPSCTFRVLQYCVNCKSFTCHVCETAKEWRLVPDSHLHNWQRNKILRCTTCHVCSGCKATRDARAFDGDSKYCRYCDMHMCTPCGETQRRNEFDENNLEHHYVKGRTDALVCLSCRKRGCTPRNPEHYNCSLCLCENPQSAFSEAALVVCRSATDKREPSEPCKDCLKIHERVIYNNL